MGRRAVILLCLLAFGTHARAQDLPDDVGFSLDGLGISDDLFAPEEDTTPDWLQPFTFRLSQQLFAQTNPHRVPVAGGGDREKNAYIENHRLSLLTRYQNPFAPGWLLQASAQIKLYWPGDYESRANGDRVDTEFRLNEFFVQRSEGDTSLKLGAQTVVWGENIGNSVLDVINTSEFRDLTIIDIEDARLNQWMLVRDRFYGNHQWSSFLNLYPEFNPPPVRGSPFFFEPAFNLTDYRRDKPLFEAGTQMRWSLTGSDISIMAAYLYENQLHYSAPPSGTGNALSEAGDYLLLGFSANRAIGRLLLNLDVAYSHDILVDVLLANGSDVGTVAVRKLGGTAGFEYAIDNEQNLMLGVTAETLLKEDEALEPGQQLLSDRSAGNALLRYSNSLRNGDLLLSVTMQSALDAASMLGSVALQYTLSNHFSLTTQAIATRADRDSALASLDHDLRLGMTLSWTF
ncbi:MAG: hypothetical protein H7A06_01020 [Pseudomonadales bacterium]|nr:hypothetical protein [Pseudomonadales bacterium]